MKGFYDKLKENTSAIQVKDLTNAETFLNLLYDKRIPVIGACACVDIDNDYVLKPICGNKHIVLISKRHSEIALELLRSIEEDFPILY